VVAVSVPVKTNKFGKGKDKMKISRISISGTGPMDLGITQLIVQSGFTVTLRSRTKES